MNDFDPAIIAMWKSLSQEPLRLNCYLHLERNVKKQSLPKGTKSKVVEDIQYLAESTCLPEFNKRWLLIKNSWVSRENEKMKEFSEYFENQYITKNNNWYVGICTIGIGNTNNALEGFNSAIKKHFTQYERQDIVVYHF